MKNRSMTIALCAIAAAAGTVGTAQAGDLSELLIIDLSVPNQITVTATAGVSASTVSGSVFTGAYMANFYSGDGASGLGPISSLASTFTNVGNASNGGAGLYRDAVDDMGLNVYGWTAASNADFFAGSQAFSGTATWTVSPSEYADMLAGNTTGLIYFPADWVGGLPDASVLGTWRVVPTPGAAAVLGLGALAAARRRRG